jgi:hypothetical protein
MEKLAILDIWITFRIFQPLTEKIQLWIGKDNFWMAKAVCLAYFLLFLTDLSINSGADTESFYSWAAYLLSVFIWMNIDIYLAEKQYRSILDNKCQAFNPKALPDLFRPMLVIVLAPLFVFVCISSKDLIMKVLNIGEITSLISVFYLIACTPLPLSESKLKEWIKKLAQKPEPELVPIKIK